jgi:hypothetical protein
MTLRMGASRKTERLASAQRSSLQLLLAGNARAGQNRLVSFDVPSNGRLEGDEIQVQPNFRRANASSATHNPQSNS